MRRCTARGSPRSSRLTFCPTVFGSGGISLESARVTSFAAPARLRRFLLGRVALPEPVARVPDFRNGKRELLPDPPHANRRARPALRLLDPGPDLGLLVRLYELSMAKEQTPRQELRRFGVPSGALETRVLNPVLRDEPKTGLAEPEFSAGFGQNFDEIAVCPAPPLNKGGDRRLHATIGHGGPLLWLSKARDGWSNGRESGLKRRCWRTAVFF